MPVSSSTVLTTTPQNLAEEQCTTTSKSNLLQEHGTVFIPTMCHEWKQQLCSLLRLSRSERGHVLSWGTRDGAGSVTSSCLSNEPLNISVSVTWRRSLISSRSL